MISVRLFQFERDGVFQHLHFFNVQLLQSNWISYLKINGLTERTIFDRLRGLRKRRGEDCHRKIETSDKNRGLFTSIPGVDCPNRIATLRWVFLTSERSSGVTSRGVMAAAMNFCSRRSLELPSV